MSMETMNQRRVSAAVTGFTKPAGAAVSAFDFGKQAKPKRARTPRIDPNEVQIKKGVPLPPASNKRESPYRALLSRMKVGDSCELEKRQAASLTSAAKAQGIKVATRVLDNGKVGVWRIKE